MTPQGKVYSLPGKVNGLELNFIFDTGASDVYLSMTEAIFMLKNGYLTKNDFTGVSYSQIANGDIVENTAVVLREVEIGGIKLQNVTASISHNLDAPLLLGQSAIQKLGPIQLDGNKLIIQNGKNFKSDKQAWDLYYKSFQDIEAEDYETA
ncbi:retropepsin-like aspartic protease, partial [Bacteroides gallinaceum]|uniref:retropepsin-like aspartic protease family protein n=1 Tax=Bacteroides gallinaceum TaxID=1462571 RepID=UPI0025AAAF04